jgi:hypothetical protein
MVSINLLKHLEIIFLVNPKIMFKCKTSRKSLDKDLDQLLVRGKETLAISKTTQTHSSMVAYLK